MKEVDPSTVDEDNPTPSAKRDVPVPVVLQNEEKRYCWVCFATEDDDHNAAWVQPCCCRGTTKWVHQTCLQRWIDEKQRGNVMTEVSCPQCNTKYIIVFPQFGLVAYALDMADRMLYKVCPFVAAGVVVGSIYWTAVTYGAVTVMQVLGHKEGLGVMEQADPLFLLVGLPTIPVMLILGRMVRWEDYILKLWRRHSAKIPGLKYLMHSFDKGLQEVNDQPTLSDPVSATRVLCGALMLPTIAAVCGRLMFSNVTSSLQKTLLGGITFIGVKGVIKIYLKQQQYRRQYQRQILDYTEHAESLPSGSTSQASQTSTSDI